MNFKIVLIIGFVFLSTVSSNDPDEFEVTSEEEEYIEEMPSIDIPYSSPTPTNPGRVYLAEHFDDEEKFKKLWIKSLAKKEGASDDVAKYDGEWALELPERDGLQGDKGLVLKTKAKLAAISSRLTKPFTFNTKPFIVQYEVTFQNGQDCGGAYLKLLSEGVETKDLSQFRENTPYTIMFGPDKCGTDYKLHFIFRHRNPKNATIEEKHCKKPKERLEDIFTDHLPHLFTLVINPDNTYEVSVDKKIFNSGSLFEDFTPPVNPPSEIDDPNDQKPEDWDEREKIPDPEATKPDDWNEDAPAQIVDESAVMPDGWLEDEPTHIPDINAQKPTDWDADMDGEWEPPLVENPACTNSIGCGKWEPPLINNPEFKGKWKAPLVDNPNYKGKWKPRRIANPDFYEDKQPFKMHTISAVGFELWTMSENILFDNLIISDSLEVIEEWAQDTYDKKRAKISKDSESVFEKLANVTNDYPALWALYILVLGIPVVFILYLCCKPSSLTSQEKEEQAAAAELKKTDGFSHDDQDIIRENQEKADELLKELVQEEGEAAEKYSGDDDDDDDDDDDEEYKQLPKAEEAAPRKRKARKE